MIGVIITESDKGRGRKSIPKVTEMCICILVLICHRRINVTPTYLFNDGFSTAVT